MRSRLLEWSDPTETLAAARDSSGLDFLRTLLDRKTPPPPMALIMNLTLASVERGRVTFTAAPGEEHYNPHGSIHGGFVSTLFDTALGCAVHSTLERGLGYTTLDLHVNFVRPLTHESGTVRCDAAVLFEGKRVATAEAKVFDERGKLCAHATTTCLIFPRDGVTS